jgi:hypothetical protein
VPRLAGIILPAERNGKPPQGLVPEVAGLQSRPALGNSSALSQVAAIFLSLSSDKLHRRQICRPAIQLQFGRPTPIAPS